MNNHTDIIEYIVSDLQMKELDKDDNVSIWIFFLSLSLEFICKIQPSLKIIIQILVGKPAVHPGCRARLHRHAGDAEGGIQHGHHEAQPGAIIAPSYTKRVSFHQATSTLMHIWRSQTHPPSLLPCLPPSLPPPCQTGDTPLHLAASNGHLDTIHLLLLHFDTRDEVNLVGNQRKHALPLCVCVCAQGLIHRWMVAPCIAQLHAVTVVSGKLFRPESHLWHGNDTW